MHRSSVGLRPRSACPRTLALAVMLALGGCDPLLAQAAPAALTARAVAAMAAEDFDARVEAADSAGWRALIRGRPTAGQELARAFLEAARKLDRKELREPLAARMAAAVPQGGSLTP